MADMPDVAVVRRVETQIELQRQLDGSEMGGEVTADTPQRLDQITAHFNGQRRQLRGWQLAQIVRCLDSPEQGVTGNIGHERSGAHGTLRKIKAGFSAKPPAPTQCMVGPVFNDSGPRYGATDNAVVHLRSCIACAYHAQIQISRQPTPR